LTPFRLHFYVSLRCRWRVVHGWASQRQHHQATSSSSNNNSACCPVTDVWRAHLLTTHSLLHCSTFY